MDRPPLDVIFEVPRPPVGKARPRMNRRTGHVYTPDKTRRFELDVAACAKASIRQLLEGPLLVDVLAVLPRPKRLCRKKDPPGFVWAPVRPDADNIRKAVLDGLACVMRDDAQVVAGQTVKVYAEKTGGPRVRVRVRALTEAGGYADTPEGRWLGTA